MRQLVLLMLLMKASFLWAESSVLFVEKKWAWKPLFNHSTMKSEGPLRGAEKSSFQRELLLQLVAFLENAEKGSGGDLVSQEENDQLLRALVRLQAKAVDQLELIQRYQNRDLPEILKMCAASRVACDEGYSVLTGFLDVQNRMEEIEAGRLDLRGLPAEQRSVFASHRFLCFYYDIRDARFREQFKNEQIQSLKALLASETVRVQRGQESSLQDKPLLSVLYHRLTGSGSQREDPALQVKDILGDAEVTSLVEGWEKRLIVAKCWRQERVLEWKRGFLQRSMPEVLGDEEYKRH